MVVSKPSRQVEGLAVRIIMPDLVNTKMANKIIAMTEISRAL